MDDPFSTTLREARELRAALETRLLKANVFRGPYFDDCRRQELKTLEHEIAALDRWIAEHTQRWE
jgi:hypothetical protein